MYVYLLRSLSHPDQRYIDVTTDLDIRLREHNSGDAKHTAKYLSWQIVVALQFTQDDRAFQFEYYLKTGSGRAFADRHLW